jgi:hypothetical protein
MTEYPTSKPIVNGRDAIAVHMRWKITFHLAVRMREPISERAMRAICNPDDCFTGQWLTSDRTKDVRHTPEYKILAARHKEFHTEMLVVATLINDGRFDDAERGLTAASSFERAANAMAGAITAFDRVQQIVSSPGR